MTNVSATAGLEEVSAPARRRRSPITDYSALAIGIIPIVLLYLASLVLPLPYSPVTPDPNAVLLPPSAAHWFGTDSSGFDVFARTIRSGRVDLPLAFGGTVLSMLIGVPLGLIASSETWFSHVVMRIVDVLQSLPLLIITVAIVSLAGNSTGNVIFALVLVGAPGFIRLTRSGAQVIRSSRFVDAAVAFGCTPARVLFVHILPNVAGLVLAQFTLGVSTAIIVIAGLNFLGVGVAPPTPAWGLMIKAGAGVVAQGDWWVALFPSLAVMLVIACLNVSARAIEDLLQGR